jgi:hypothetical protein
MVDRLMHNAEVGAIEGDSYRAKKAKERASPQWQRINMLRQRKCVVQPVKLAMSSR